MERFPVRYAHTLPDTDPSSWEPIETHLLAVSRAAEAFARELRKDGRAAAWGEVLGRWHDLGKHSDDFQKMLCDANDIEAHLEGQSGRVDHSTAGAQHASESVAGFGRLLAYAIAGHHAGLGEDAELTKRLSKRPGEDLPAWRSHADVALLEAPALGGPPVSAGHQNPKRGAFQLAFFTRMLFSCLIDADRLETEAFCDPAKAADRVAPPPLSQLSETLDERLAQLVADAEPTSVNQQRAAILAACRAAADRPPGFFSLTVPTGGGKTLSSLAFALDHACRQGQRRVVMAIPFTSIIEQTADVYRKLFAELGDGVVLEHHASLDPERETWRNRLAVENWDAPLVVTTNVQLFESLFACRTTPCRKLHRLAGSVIILDEAQTLPVGLLKPCLWALRELVEDYGCTVVLCTATQPALELRDDFKIGLEGVTEIIPAPEELAAAMRRVEVRQLGRTSDDELIERLGAERSWLAIVNTKPHAAGIYQQLAGEGNPLPSDLFHLSTRMCAQHRSDKLTEVRRRLKAGEPCRVVSTQLIEAGVDVDFPVVFRAMAGVDSIAQAAGRCNREGKLDQRGVLWLFDPADVQPKGDLGAMAAKTRELLPEFPGGDGSPDLLDPAAVRRYFELWYWNRAGANQWDEENVLGCFPPGSGFAYDFRTAAERFQMINDQTRTVFVPYGEGEQLLEQLRRAGPSRHLLRKLQRYGVGLHEWEWQALVTAGDIETLDSGYDLLANQSAYCKNLGLRTDRPGYYEAESTVI